MSAILPGICVVSGFRSYPVTQKTVAKDGVDFIALSRPLIREPDLPDKWTKNHNTDAACISCNKCFLFGMTKGGVYCVAQKKE